MQFDVVATNPPFQDSTNRKRTQHKLWIDFTQQTFDKWLKPGGILLQVSLVVFYHHPIDSQDLSVSRQ